MVTLELNQKQLTHIILALEGYARALEEDEDDPGPSMADAMYVADLARIFRARHAEGSKNET